MFPNLLGQKAYHRMTDDDMAAVIGVSRNAYQQKIKSGRFTPDECKDGITPQFDGMLALAWGFVKPKLDRDEESYDNAKLQRQYAAFCKQRKNMNLPKIPLEEWMQMDPDERKRMATADNGPLRPVDSVAPRYPSTSTTAAVSTSTSSSVSTTAAASANRLIDTAAAADREIKALQGELGKGVVFMSTEQMEDLLERLGLDAYDYYVKKLANFIIKNNPDYSLYPELTRDTAYGFLTRGCPNACPFCIVSEKEGRCSRKVADLSEWWNGQKNIVLMDPNLLACRDHMDLLKQLADSGAWVDVNQGFDARLLTPENIGAINRIKIKNIHFAWDMKYQTSAICRGLSLWKKLGKKDSHGSWGTVYVLVNFNTDMEENLDRIYILRDMGYDPYVMVYDKPNAPREIRLLQR